MPTGQAPRALPAGGFGKQIVPFCAAPLGVMVARDGHGRAAQFVISSAPRGRPLLDLADGGPWSESELIETLIQPVAAALAALQSRMLTHRAIRPNNVFQVARGQPVMLGCAWAASPARDQPAVYEPPYSAVCAPQWRDDGVVADDVYALGVLMVALACGAAPMAGLDDATVVARKITVGSVAAILGEARLSPMIADLARGMLAEDPEHRPSPSLLADPEAARARRVAARPRRRAQRAIQVGQQTVWDSRGLADALAREPVQGIQALRSGAADQWLRRALGDATIALVLEEAIRQRLAETTLEEADADGILLLRAVAALDPLAPLCWRGLRLWPDALGSGLAAAEGEDIAALIRILEVEAFAAWAFARAHRCDPVRAQADAKGLRSAARQRGWGGGIARLRYVTVPMLPCRSPWLEGSVVVALADLAPALERLAERLDRPSLPLDAEMAGFLAARMGFKMDGEFAAMGKAGAADNGVEAALAQLRVLARIQNRVASPPLPRLAGWLATEAGPILAQLRSRARQATAREALEQHIATGRLANVLAVFDDQNLLEADRREAAAAEAAIARLSNEITQAQRRQLGARSDASRLGREIAASLGLVALAVAAVMAVL